MTDKLFKVRVYKVETLDSIESGQMRFAGRTKFENAITRAYAQSITNRCRLINGKYRRLEECRQDAEYSLLHFVTSEFTGPGRFSQNQAVTPINLAPDESFSHGTAMLYDHQAKIAFVETTLVGMGSRAIANYCEMFVDDMTKYDLVPRLDEDASARARKHNTIRRVDMKANIGPVTRADRDGGYGAVQAFGNELEGETIFVRISVSRARTSTLLIRKVWELFNYASGSTSEDNAVTEFKLSGREHDNDNLEDIDLIEHHESRERLLTVDSTLRQISYQDRWNALIEIRQEFLA